MIIANLVNARPAIGLLYAAKVDGKTAMRIRKVIRLVQQPLSDYDDAVKAWAEAEDVDGKKIADLSPAQKQYWLDMLSATVEQTWEPPVTVDELSGLELSAEQIDLLITAGLIDELDE